MIIDTLRLLKALRQAIADAEAAVLSGQPADWSEYRRSVGYLDGLKRALTEVLDEVGKHKSNQEDD